ncbi:hypothetical protein [Streptomyces sp. NPDC002133]|uniref:hypothetical protein n=1 Tax=Streptomyces sp. NPDC002133 TaxID=3154409 RepID=UPI003332B87C
MPIDPFAALNAMIRAEAARTDPPPEAHASSKAAAPEPEREPVKRGGGHHPGSEGDRTR